MNSDSKKLPAPFSGSLLWRFLLLSGIFVWNAPAAEVPNRGLTAVSLLSQNASSPQTGTFLSWRRLNEDPDATQFRIFRDGREVARVRGTCWTDVNGTADSHYEIVTDSSQPNASAVSRAACRVWKNGFLTLRLDRPQPETMPDGSVCDYAPNDCSAADLDGDGNYELVVKWNPSNAKDCAQSGFTGTVFLDAYRIPQTDGPAPKLWRIALGRNVRAGAHYSPFIVFDLDGDGRAEVLLKTADGTIDGAGTVLGDASADYRSPNGKILEGPEFLSVFDGQTGAVLDSVPYLPPREILPAERKKGWGDDYGNRQDRFLAAAAFLDGHEPGRNPSAIFFRGYYTASYGAAYDWVDRKLKLRWFHRSEVPNQGLFGEGNHNLAVGDLDGDGRDEIVLGSAALDQDGTLLYRTGFGHGDALHLGDFDPDRPGLELWDVHEERESPYGCELRAADGTVLWGIPAHRDVGRGLAADLIPENRGAEFWSAAVRQTIFDRNGREIAKVTSLPTNFRIYWDGDLFDELLDGTRISHWVKPADAPGDVALLHDFQAQNGSASINGTKANPCLSADLIGDWREEVIFMNRNDPAEINLFTTTIPTNYSVPHLMLDPVYRLAVVTQNVAYNQPPHLGYYLPESSDLRSFPPAPPADE